ncbi:MAG: hypothetical protein LBB84_09565, partial [Tannerellaceae bacterium]|nr:hypothetical protein [Tannerellaceae bacterium]
MMKKISSKRNMLLTILLLTTMFHANNCTQATKTDKIIKITKTLAKSFVIFSETVSAINELTINLTDNTKKKLTT